MRWKRRRRLRASRRMRRLEALLMAGTKAFRAVASMYEAVPGASKTQFFGAARRHLALSEKSL